MSGLTVVDEEEGIGEEEEEDDQRQYARFAADNGRSRAITGGSEWSSRYRCSSKQKGVENSVGDTSVIVLTWGRTYTLMY
eukprot:2016308-Rhodomonas_salina.1